MILTTTNTIERRRIAECKQIVLGEVVSGVDFIKDFVAGFTDFFGGRPNSYEGELMDVREKAIQGLQGRAAALEANVVIGVDTDYEVLGTGNNMLMMIAPGTAVVAE